MQGISLLTTFFGWCCVLNFAMLLFAILILIRYKVQIISLHHRLFGVSSASLEILYMKYLANYKIGILLFNFTPYLALRIISGMP